MENQWKLINVCYDRNLFNIFCQMIKLPQFVYSEKPIEHEYEVKGMGKYKMVAVWQSEEICEYDIYKKVLNEEKV